MSTSPLGSGSSEKPPLHERSRNAKAQARHRAKRKAYIERLEETVTRLQTELGLPPDDMDVLPPSLAKIRELQTENARLLRENEEMRRLLQRDDTGREFEFSPADVNRRDMFYEDRDGRRRRMPTTSGQYISGSMYNSDQQPEVVNNSRLSRLSIPSMNYHHQTAHSVNDYTSPTSRQLFMPNQVPITPSAASSTSSPPFSPQSPHGHTHGHNMYSLSAQSVKTEDDERGYYTGIQHPQASDLTPTAEKGSNYGYGSQYEHQGYANSWHTYSSERSGQLR